MKKNFNLYIFLILIITNSYSYSYFDSSSYGTTGASILKLNTSPRCVSMGNACSSDVNDASSVDINPANMIKANRFSIFLSHNIFFENISMQSLSFITNLGKNSGSFGVGIKYLNWGSITKTDEYANDAGSFNPYEMVIAMGFAGYLTGITKDVEDRIVFGGTGKLIINKIENTASTLSADVGILFPYLFERRFVLSVVFQNITGNIKMDKENYNITKIIKIGSSTFLNKNLTINSDIIMPQDRFPYLSIGIETMIDITRRTKFFIRGGANTSNLKDMEGTRSVSFGFGLKSWEYNIDYSFSPFGNLGNIHRISISLNY